MSEGWERVKGGEAGRDSEEEGGRAGSGNGSPKAVEAYECAGSMRAVLNDEQARCAYVRLTPRHRQMTLMSERREELRR